MREWDVVVQFLGTTGIIAIRVVTSVVAIQRTRGTIAVVRIDAETQSQRREYRSCRHNDGSTAISRFRRSGPNARLDRGADGFLLPPVAARHVTTCRSGMILFVCFAYSYFYFLSVFLLCRSTSRLADGFRMAAIASPFLRLRRCCALLRYPHEGLGTNGISAMRAVTSVVAIQRTRGTIAVVRIEAETQSQRREYRSCRHNDGSTAISRFRRSGPNARLDRGADGFLLPPVAARHVTTCRSGMILFVCFAYSYFYFLSVFLLCRSTSRLADGFRMAAIASPFLRLRRCCALLRYPHEGLGTTGIRASREGTRAGAIQRTRGTSAGERREAETQSQP